MVFAVVVLWHGKQHRWNEDERSRLGHKGGQNIAGKPPRKDDSLLEMKQSRLVRLSDSRCCDGAEAPLGQGCSRLLSHMFGSAIYRYR